MNRLAIDRFRFGLQWCLAKAVEMVGLLGVCYSLKLRLQGQCSCKPVGMHACMCRLTQPECNIKAQGMALALP